MIVRINIDLVGVSLIEVDVFFNLVSVFDYFFFN